jgi:hypothetical protein
VGLREGTLPGDREERRPRIHIIRACEPVSDAAMYLTSSTVVSLNDAKPEQHLVKSANERGQIKLAHDYSCGNHIDDERLAACSELP